MSPYTCVCHEWASVPAPLMSLILLRRHCWRVSVPWCEWKESLCKLLLHACREGATLSGRMCAYKILNAAPELARSEQREPAMALA